jgi:hypothetical protein
LLVHEHILTEDVGLRTLLDLEVADFVWLELDIDV